MKQLKSKSAVRFGILATCSCLLQPATALAYSISFTNTFTISSSHTLNAALGLGAHASYADTNSASLPLFNNNSGALTSVTLRVDTVDPTFTGKLSVTLLGLNIGYSQTQNLKYTLSNLGTGDTGATVGPSGLSIKASTVQTTISTTPATLSSTMTYTGASQLAKFGTNSSTGKFSVNGELDSYYNMGLVSALSSMQGTGSYPMQMVVTYNYRDLLSAAPMSAPQGGGGMIMLSYPTNSTGYEFETINTLNGSAWQAITNGIIISNGNYMLMVPTTSPQQFFRLHVKTP